MESTTDATSPESAGYIRTSTPRNFGVALLNMLERLGIWTVQQLSKPGVRAVVIGIILIVIGVFAIDHSVWTFPLVIIGIILIVAAWAGSRLQGHFGIEWGDGNAHFELQAGFKARTPATAAAGSIGSTTSTSAVSSVHPVRPVPHAVGQGDVIDGESHTIEIDVEELRALVAAAERVSDAAGVSTDGASVNWQKTPSAPESVADSTTEHHASSADAESGTAQDAA